MSKTILITGAGSGLGKGTAIGLAKQGHVVIATTENEDQARALKEETAPLGLNIDISKLDVMDRKDHEEIINKYGSKVDILVNNAAVGQAGPIAEIPIERVRRVFDVNFFGTLELTQKFAREFAERNSGKIIFVSSIVGFMVFPFLGPYVASKHALEAIAQSMREEMVGTGVQIATINPGAYQTGFNDRNLETMNEWYNPNRHFTSEKQIQAVKDKFAEDGFQMDPEEMIDAMVKIIPADNHKFRNVYPPVCIDDGKSYQANLWDVEV